MIALLEEKRDELIGLCARYHVRRLTIFGSATREDFDLARSDLDFTVEFGDVPDSQLAKHYFGLLFALEDLFQRPIDLLMPSAVTNPYFRQELDATQVELYAA